MNNGKWIREIKSTSVLCGLRAKSISQLWFALYFLLSRYVCICSSSLEKSKLHHLYLHTCTLQYHLHRHRFPTFSMLVQNRKKYWLHSVTCDVSTCSLIIMKKSATYSTCSSQFSPSHLCTTKMIQNDGMDEKKIQRNCETSEKLNLNQISCRGMYLQQLAGKV